MVVKTAVDLGTTRQPPDDILTRRHRDFGDGLDGISAILERRGVEGGGGGKVGAVFVNARLWVAMDDAIEKREAIL